MDRNNGHPRKPVSTTILTIGEQMDKIDFKIIRKLMEDSRCSFRKISIELGVSTDTVIRRYKKLRKTGAIKPIINVDIFKLGYEVRVWYMISLMHQTNLSSTIDEIAKIQDASRIIKAVGDYDLLVIASVKDFKHMYKIRNLSLDSFYKVKTMLL